jgi:hypothetical protein
VVTDSAALIDAVHSALREALKVPETDRTLSLIEHPASHFAVPPCRGEKFTLVEVTMFSGRSLGAKRTLYRAIVRNLAAHGVPMLDIKITLIEIPPEKPGRARRHAGVRNRPRLQHRRVAVKQTRAPAGCQAAVGRNSVCDRYRTVRLP